MELYMNNFLIGNINSSATENFNEHYILRNTGLF